MPFPDLPPTPAASADITGKDRRNSLVGPDLSLPPSAWSNRSSDSSDATNQATSIFQSTLPLSPQQSSQSQSGSYESPPEVSLPPPPTRSRKIIQMKPKTQQTKQPSESPRLAAQVESKISASPSAGVSKKRAPGTNAGRKIARKTAHSLIERRRRSKMNEEFNTLKDLIPACVGQEMHKLAILQAGIDYVRYLHQCIADLKAARKKDSPYVTAQYSQQQQREGALSQPSTTVSASEAPSDEEMEDDEFMEHSSPIYYPLQPTSSHLGQYGPNGLPSMTESRPLTSTSQQLLASPNHGPTRSAYDSHRSYPISPFTTASISANSDHPSPMLLPQQQGMEDTSELDHEASAALLMLNAGDRRSIDSKAAEQPSNSRKWIAPESRGMSVKDLLRN